MLRSKVGTKYRSTRSCTAVCDIYVRAPCVPCTPRACMISPPHPQCMRARDRAGARAVRIGYFKSIMQTNYYASPHPKLYPDIRVRAAGARAVCILITTPVRTPNHPGIQLYCTMSVYWHGWTINFLVYRFQVHLTQYGRYEATLFAHSIL